MSDNFVEWLKSRRDGTTMPGAKKMFAEAVRRLEWIPVTKRMPNENVPVNITWTNNNPEPYYEAIKGKRYTATGIYFRGDWYWYSSICEDMLAEYGRWEADRIDDDIEIVAWMALPEPYTEETT